MSISKPLKILVTLETRSGMRGIMFDRYAGSNTASLRNEEKLYLSEKSEIILPPENIYSFLYATNTQSATKTLYDSRTYRTIARALACSVTIEEDKIVFNRGGNPIIFGALGKDERDPKSGVYVHHSVARLAKGIPNPKQRPVLPAPWSLSFSLFVLPSKELSVQDIKRIFEEGGTCVGLGTFRPQYGRFMLTRFEVSEVK